MLGPAMDIWTLLQLGYWTVLGAVFLIVLIFGGIPERIGISIIGVGSVLSTLLSKPEAMRFETLESGIALIDVFVLVGFVWLALTSKRYWPLWATSFHTTDMLTHAATALMPQALPKAYGILQGFWAYPMMAVILVGTYGFRRRQRAKKKQQGSF
jgi:hypothetical protein